jgi:L,D-peptidoglycan transpeptidase YkuD (ErfK/YbiS/YcfS/YnhG family)
MRPMRSSTGRVLLVTAALAGVMAAGVGAGAAMSGSSTVRFQAVSAFTGPVSTSASVAATAARGTAVQVTPTLPEPTTTVSPACRPPAGVPADARQVVVVRTPSPTSTTATVDLLVNVDGGWTCARIGMAGRVGKSGVRPLAQRVSGDGTTPAGIFPLGTMTAPDGQTFQFFGNGVDPGVPGAWRQVRSGDCWDATGGDASYNTLTHRAAGACTGDDEYLPAVSEAYSRAALIGANMGPERSGDQPGETPRAAAIFLHRFSYDSAGRSKPTSGCVSLAGDDLDTVLRALVPGEAWFVIGA